MHIVSLRYVATLAPFSLLTALQLDVHETMSKSIGNALAVKNTTNQSIIQYIQNEVINIVNEEYTGILQSDGTATAPALYFASDVKTGLYRPSSNTISVSTNGTQRLTTSTSAVTSTLPLRVADGSATAPVFAFSSDTNCGLYRIGTDNIGLSTGGNVALSISNAEITNALPLIISDGSFSEPSVRIASSETGLYKDGSTSLGFAVNGVKVGNVDTNAWRFIHPVRGFVDGTATAPSYSFTNDTNTGIYPIAADQFGFSTNGTLRLDISTTAITSTLPILNQAGSNSAPAYAFATDVDTGLYLAAEGSLGFAAGGLRAFELDVGGAHFLNNIIFDTTVSPVNIKTIQSDTCEVAFDDDNAEMDLGINGMAIMTIGASSITCYEPLVLPQYTDKDSFDGTPVVGMLVAFSEGDGSGPCLGYYDGSDWKKITLGATVD